MEDLINAVTFSSWEIYACRKRKERKDFDPSDQKRRYLAHV